jgi:lysophosphatidic acid acyltransferase/lysophosphatidylinositol acyltransferase
MYYISYFFLAQIVFLFDFWSNSRINLYISDEDYEYLGKEHTFAFINHYYEIDWLTTWSFLEKIGVLGNAKGFIKKQIQYVPVAGWFFKLGEHIFLERAFEKDRVVLENQLQIIMEYPDPVWPVMTAEGTRFTKTKQEASNKFAIEHNLEPLKHHLIPRTKGFTTCLPILKKHCPSIMNLQLAFDNDTKSFPSVGTLLKGKKLIAHLYVKRIPMSEVPADEKEAAAYVQQLYREKDKIMDSFLNYGDFFTGSNMKPIKPRSLKPRINVLVNFLAWMAVTLVPILYTLTKLMLNGKFILFLIISASVVGLVYFAMQKSITASKISKASEYGTKNSK